MLLQRDTLIVAIALGVAASLYVISFRDLMAASSPAVGASSSAQPEGGFHSIFATAPAPTPVA